MILVRRFHESRDEQAIFEFLRALQTNVFAVDLTA